jgi:predicted glycogen debranching enzyme
MAAFIQFALRAKSHEVQNPIDDKTEWLEADGLGGFASGTTSGIRTRRYHALLLVATTPPSGRVVLVNGLDAWTTLADKTYALSSQRYSPDVVLPDGTSRLQEFRVEPWPTWRWVLEPGIFVEQELFVPRGNPTAILSWKLIGTADVQLNVRLFLSGRDFHALQRQNPTFQFKPSQSGDRLTWYPYSDRPAVVCQTNGAYQHAPDWYVNFLYAEERARGLDCVEDLAAPGILSWKLSNGPAHMVLSADQPLGSGDVSVPELVEKVRRIELDRRSGQQLDRAVDSYLVARGDGKTVIAGYPWFGDWGRDTFVSLRGLCLATRRWSDAREILLEWAGTVSQGMLPNRFPDKGTEPEFNSVDASLWYVIAVNDFLGLAPPTFADVATVRQLTAAIDAILSGYREGTRFAIRATDDGLLAAGAPGMQLTWMDAKIGDFVVTPRIGKPVEVQALWLNALSVGARFSESWQTLFEKGVASFRSRFWNEERECLYDVIDVDHQSDKLDAALRPNQVFAVGGLPLVLLPLDQAKRVIDLVEAQLHTPIGLRSLGPGEPGYEPRYEGDPWHRDMSYHQGTVWPWLLGAFVEGWVRVRGNTIDAKRDAREKFLTPIFQHLNEAGLGHVSEIADAEPPYTPRGCPFQAWSLGELLRLDRLVL